MSITPTRDQLYRGDIVEASMSAAAVGNGASIYMGITVGAKAVTIQQIRYFGSTDAIIALHEGIAIADGTAAQLRNYNRNKPDTLDNATVLKNITATLDPLNGDFIGAGAQQGSILVESDAVIVLKPGEEYIIQVENNSGGNQDMFLAVALGEQKS